MGGRLQALFRLVHGKGRQAGPEGIAVDKSVFYSRLQGMFHSVFRLMQARGEMTSREHACFTARNKVWPFCFLNFGLYVQIHEEIPTPFLSELGTDKEEVDCFIYRFP